MIRAVLASALISLAGCYLPEKATPPLAHAVIVTPLPANAAITQNHGAPKGGSALAPATPSDPAAAVLDAIGQAKDTVERRSYILDERAGREVP